jgi:hypothetical protein
MAIIVSTTETIVPVVKKKLFDYVRFQTKTTNTDFLGDTELCQMATIVEQDYARQFKFITKKLTITWEVADTDAELPEDYFEFISYKTDGVETPVKSVVDFADMQANGESGMITIYFDGTSRKVHLPSAVTDVYTDTVYYYSIPVYSDPNAWVPSFSEHWFGLVSAKLIMEVFTWIASNPSERISDASRKLAANAIPIWKTKEMEAKAYLIPNESKQTYYKGSYF